MTEANGSKRVTCKRRHPNQLFHELLESLYRDAIENRSSIVPTLKEAISSLEKYPLPLSSGAECAILKGFDQRLCRYIDSRLNRQTANNKKTKICANGNSGNKNIDKLRLSAAVDEISDSKMTSNAKSSHRKNKELETNSKRCPFQSKFGESSNNKAANNNISSIDLINLKAKSEKNNNTTTESLLEDYSNPAALNFYFVNRSKIDSDHNKEESEDIFNKINFAISENWNTLSNDQPHTSKSISEIKTLCQPIEILDESEDENFVTNDNEFDFGQPYDSCSHAVETVHCKQCQLYSIERMKRGIEGIGKYTPRRKVAFRSGAYAILVALLEQHTECPYRDCLSKDELIQKAQKHTDESFTKPKPESKYTAWSNAKRLMSKGMVQITRFDDKNEDFYKLTANGRAIAMELVNENIPKVTVNDVIFQGQWNDRVPSLEDVVLIPPPSIVSKDDEQSSVFIEMPPGTFNIVMLIDKRENFDKTLLASPNNCCKYETRNLSIGDFLWIARSKKTGQELVLPYILERKRMDDLASSIKDGRFHEQKFRLRKCGLKNVLYLVENYKATGQYALPLSVLMQAVINTSIVDEFNVVKTDSLDHTFRFLGMLSERLVHEFSPIFLRGCNRDTEGKELMTFDFFNKFSNKNKPLSVKDTFSKMLLQLKGISVEKALAITNKYRTPRLLMKAYEECNDKEGELLLAKLKLNPSTQNVGPTVSKTVYKLFSREV